MKGEMDLDKLISSMQPVINDGQYVFLTIERIEDTGLHPLLFLFREQEAITIIVSRDYADANQLKYESVFAWITLKIHSALEAVGLTAAFSTALADAGISCNVIAAFHHDHIFVPVNDSDKVLKVLEQLSASKLNKL